MTSSIRGWHQRQEQEEQTPCGWLHHPTGAMIALSTPLATPPHPPPHPKAEGLGENKARVL